MAVKKKARKSVMGDTSHKAVDSAIATINEVAASATKAVLAVNTEYKKLTKTAKSLNKKRAALMKKVRTAKNKLKKEATAANRKIVASLKKDIVAIKKEADKIRNVKTSVAEELATLKTVSKRALAYAKGVASVDKVLNKPKKKRRKKRAKAAV